DRHDDGHTSVGASGALRARSEAGLVAHPRLVLQPRQELGHDLVSLCRELLRRLRVYRASDLPVDPLGEELRLDRVVGIGVAVLLGLLLPGRGEALGDLVLVDGYAEPPGRLP